MSWTLFEQAAIRYEAWYATPPGRRADRAERALLSRLLGGFPAPQQVLEVGCGTGHFTTWLASQGWWVVGLDRAPAMLAEMHQQFPDIPVIMGDAHRLPMRARRSAMPCCCGHHCHAWHCGGPPEPYPPSAWRYGPPSREDYVRRLEEEPDLLEQRLRRLEREIEDLRRVARPTPGPLRADRTARSSQVWITTSSRMAGVATSLVLGRGGCHRLQATGRPPLHRGSRWLVGAAHGPGGGAPANGSRSSGARWARTAMGAGDIRRGDAEWYCCGLSASVCWAVGVRSPARP